MTYHWIQMSPKCVLDPATRLHVALSKSSVQLSYFDGEGFVPVADACLASLGLRRAGDTLTPVAVPASIAEARDAAVVALLALADAVPPRRPAGQGVRLSDPLFGKDDLRRWAAGIAAEVIPAAEVTP